MIREVKILSVEVINGKKYLPLEEGDLETISYALVKLERDRKSARE